MDEVLRIAPATGDPGLVAYECPQCRHLTSVLLEPSERTSDQRKLSKRLEDHHHDESAIIHIEPIRTADEFVFAIPNEWTVKIS
jgi:hypothetical protein